MQKNQFNKISFNNFKPFGKKMQTFSKKPITLIYGENSIGKSSLIHMMNYRNYIQETKKFNISEINNGDTISLGGFMNFVHNKNINNNINLNYNIDIPRNNNTIEILLEIGIDDKNDKVNIQKITYIIDNDIFLEVKNNQINGNIKHWLFQKWISEIKEKGNWSEEDMNSLLKEITSLEYKTEDNNEIDFLSDIFNNNGLDSHEDKNINSEGRKKLKEKFMSWTKENEDSKLKVEVLMEKYTTNLLEESEGTIKQYIEEDQSFILGLNFYLLNDKDTLSLKNMLLHMAIDISMIINFWFWEKQKPFMYIGPLRFYPERHSAYQEQKESKSKSSEAFWSQLQDKPDLVSRLNEWLQKLSTPYFIMFRKLYNLDNLFSGDMRRLSKKRIEEEASFIEELVFIDSRSGTPVHNREMGLGITQLLPIIGNCISLNKHIIAIEQPELHLHPKLQAEIADEFIRSYKENNNELIIETHSEHLLLRIMKRMRHTAEDRPNRDKSLDLTPDDVCLLYVDNDDGNTFINELELDNDGTLLDPWPNGFFEEGHRERFD